MMQGTVDKETGDLWRMAFRYNSIYLNKVREGGGREGERGRGEGGEREGGEGREGGRDMLLEYQGGREGHVAGVPGREGGEEGREGEREGNVARPPSLSPTGHLPVCSALCWQCGGDDGASCERRGA